MGANKTKFEYSYYKTTTPLVCVNSEVKTLNDCPQFKVFYDLGFRWFGMSKCISADIQDTIVTTHRIYDVNSYIIKQHIVNNDYTQLNINMRLVRVIVTGDNAFVTSIDKVDNINDSLIEKVKVEDNILKALNVVIAEMEYNK